MCWTRSRWRKCSSRSVTSRPRSCPCSARSSRNCSAPACPCRPPGRRAGTGLFLDGAKELEDGLDGHLIAGGRCQLVERRLGVPVRASRASGDQRQYCVGRLDALRVRDPPQLPDQLGEPRPREDERLAPRPDGREHLRDVGGAEDEDEVGRRLLDQLQECVEGCIRQLVRLVEDVDLVAALDRLEHDALADLPDVVDPALRGGVHLDHVERGPVRDRDARVAGAVGGGRRPLRAVQRFREDPRQRRLPGAARPGEQVRLPDLLGLDRIPKRAHDGLLADDLVEALRAVFPIEGSQEREPPIRSDSAEQRALPVCCHRRTSRRTRAAVRRRTAQKAPPGSMGSLKVVRLSAKRPARTLCRGRVPSRCSRWRARARRSAAPARHSLALLPPGPDAVRRLTVRGT